MTGLTPSQNGALFFHAGTRQSGNQVVTDGGRVIAVTGKGASLEEARTQAYQSLSGISFEQAYFRRDIGVDLLQTRKP